MNPATRCAAALASCLLVHTASLPAAGQGLAPAAGGRAPAPGVILPPPSVQPAAMPTRHLSVDEAVALALENNLGIQSERYGPQIQDMAVADARSVWLPNLTFDALRDNAVTPSATFLDGVDTQVINKLFSNVFTVNQQLPWAGGSYTAGWDGARRTTTSFFSSFNPALSSNLRLSYTQPLLRNLPIDAGRQQVAVATTNREIADIGLRQAIAATERSVRNGYWDLVFAIAFHEVQRQSLELAEESLRNNRARVEVGTMAPIDIVEAEAEVARNQEAVILAEAQIARAEDVLRTLVLDPAAPDFWTVRLQPTDTPLLGPRRIDVDQAIRSAIGRRTDIDQIRKQIDNTDTNARFFANQRLPDVNLHVDYSVAGLGGRRFLRGPGFPGPVIGQQNYAFGEVLGDLLGNDFPSWQVGLTVGYPLGRSTADANLARARLERSQADARLREVEIRVAGEVRDVARRVNTSLQRVEATRVARELAERRLDAEQRRFEVALSTSFFVFRAQRDLAVARNNELLATLDYLKALVDFEAVQEVPLIGG
ncbi:MAG: TolC family protein [Acidobacteria bacterium]|nr:TolC family protein [Acidobacteriota bacterium]